MDHRIEAGRGAADAGGEEQSAESPLLDDFEDDEQEAEGSRYAASTFRHEAYARASDLDAFRPFFEYLTPSGRDPDPQTTYRIRLAALISILTGPALELSYREIRERLSWIQPAEESIKVFRRLEQFGEQFGVLSQTPYGYEVSRAAKLSLAWMLQAQSDPNPSRTISMMYGAIRAGAEAGNDEETVAMSLDILLGELRQAILVCDQAIQSRHPHHLKRALNEAKVYREKMDIITTQLRSLVREAKFRRLRVQECIAVKEQLIGRIGQIFELISQRHEGALNGFGQYITSAELMESLLRQPSLEAIGEAGLADLFVPKVMHILDPDDIVHRALQAIDQEEEAPPVEFQELVEVPVEDEEIPAVSDLDRMRSEIKALLAKSTAVDQVGVETHLDGREATPGEAIYRSALISAVYASAQPDVTPPFVLEVAEEVHAMPDGPYAAANGGTITATQAEEKGDDSECVA